MKYLIELCCATSVVRMEKLSTPRALCNESPQATIAAHMLCVTRLTSTLVCSLTSKLLLAWIEFGGAQSLKPE